MWSSRTRTSVTTDAEIDVDANQTNGAVMTDRLNDLYDGARAEPMARQPASAAISPRANSPHSATAASAGSRRTRSIFQKAIQGSSRLRRPVRRAGRRRTRSIDRRLLGAGAARTSTAPATCSTGSTTSPTDSTASSASRSTPDLAHDEPGTEAAARDLHERIDRRNLMVKIPGHRRGLAADRADDRRGTQHQRHVDLQPRPLRAR